MQEQVSLKMFAAVKATEQEINSTLDRVDRMLVDATIASSLNSLYREIVNDTETATNVKEVLQLAVDDSERQARGLVRSILLEGLSISDYCKTVNYDKLCESFRGIVGMDVRRKMGRALIVERGDSSAALNQCVSPSHIKEADNARNLSSTETFDHDVVWRMNRVEPSLTHHGTYDRTKSFSMMG